MASRANRSYGAPISSYTEPGQTTRKRPKPGDKDPNYKPKKKKTKKAKPAKPKSSTPKKKPPYTVSDKDSEGRPVGKGGRARERTIMSRVDRAVKGK